MAFDPKSVSPELQLAVEQWYYREARLLDNRQYQSWLALCSQDKRLHCIRCGSEDTTIYTPTTHARTHSDVNYIASLYEAVWKGFA